jgi:Holliday junction resolvase RusA-like endonuclease
MGLVAGAHRQPGRLCISHAGVCGVSNVITFTLAGIPKGKGRPRFAAGRTYTPADTVNAEINIAFAARQAMHGQPPMEGPVQAVIVSRFPVPASWSAKKRAEAIAGKLLPTKKPDADNVIKLLCDACNQIVYRDDAQIVSVAYAKSYGETPGLTASFHPIAA